MSELSKHKRHDDAWLLIHGKVYDVTEWQHKHPGGDIIILGSGTDSTAMFEMYHPNGVHSAILEKYCIGTIDETTVSNIFRSRICLMQKCVLNRRRTNKSIIFIAGVKEVIL